MLCYTLKTKPLHLYKTYQFITFQDMTFKSIKKQVLKFLRNPFFPPQSKNLKAQFDRHTQLLYALKQRGRDVRMRVQHAVRSVAFTAQALA